jgi:parallel beta-helix repeat protein
MIVLSRVKLISEILAVLVLIVLLTSAFNVQLAKAEPRTWIVDDDGPADFRTIKEAVNAAGSGDIIFVHNGTYYERVVVNKALRLVGEDKSATVIDGNRTTPLWIKANYVAVSGFTIRGGSQWLEQGIWVDGACHCNITNNYVKDNNHGFSVVGGDSNSISGNIITNNGAGIFGDGTENNSVSGNIITNNQEGICLSSSSSNSISGNDIRNNTLGIVLDHVLGNCIFENTIKNNAAGIIGHSADCNRIYGNNITANTDCGISLGSCDRNIVYHNNFINNTYQADISYTFNNTWDDGYPSGGNYWSDYEEKYPDAGEIDDSGIWDKPYVIDENNTDRYPLMTPYAALLGDLDNDRDVDEDDLWYFCSAFIDYYKIHVKDPLCDFDEDCDIDEDDLWKMCQVFLFYWKQH